MRAWWQGTRLVAERGIAESLRSRTLRIVTGLMLLLAVGAVTVPQMVGQRTTTYTLATVGQAPPAMVTALASAAGAGGGRVTFLPRASGAEVRAAVRDGDATAGLVDGTLVVSTRDDGTFPALVSQTVVALTTAQRLEAAGLSQDQIAAVQSIQPPQQVAVGSVRDSGRGAVGYAVGIVLYLALVLAGTSIATTVAMEKSNRISEILLAVLRPSQVLVGTVMAVGLVTVAQLLILAIPLGVTVRVNDAVGIPPVATGDMALGVGWFLLGFAVYGFLFAAAAALVNKITEVSSAIMPITITLVAGYLLAIIVVAEDPSSVWSVLLSIFPLTAPMAMPIRWSSGEVPAYELALAMALTGVAAVLLAQMASSIYRRALVITGHRVRWREVLSRPARAAHSG